MTGWTLVSIGDAFVLNIRTTLATVQGMSPIVAGRAEEFTAHRARELLRTGQREINTPVPAEKQESTHIITAKWDWRRRRC